MNKIDTELLHQFQHKLNQMVNDSEENYYIIKYLMNEMDIEAIYDNALADDELRLAFHKLELTIDKLTAMKQIMAEVYKEYEEMINRHDRQVEKLAEYGRGLKRVHDYLSSENTATPASLDHVYTSPIEDVLQETYGFIGVEMDE